MRTVPFAGEFAPDGSWLAPFTGPGIHLLLGGDFPPGIDAGAFWASRVSEEDRAQYDEGMARQQRGVSSQMEYRILGLDGVVRWIRECTRASPQPDGSIRIDGIVTDVTDQQASADAVQELEKTLARYAGSARLGARSPRRVPLRVALPPRRARRDRIRVGADGDSSSA